jgi:hypothetical protein
VKQPPISEQSLLTRLHQAPQRNLLNRTFWIKIAWAAFFVTLPVTSFPFFPSGLGGQTLVRPLAAYPLLLLVLLITLPRLFRRPLPRTFIPLLAFLVAAAISSIIALNADLESLRGVSLESRLLRNIATLALGTAFYLTISLLPDNWEEMKFSLRWLYVGFALALLWGTVQAVYIIHFSPTYFAWINRLQGLLSSRKLFTSRISGMTYEPKWFAEQICFMLLPWLLGAVLSKRSLYPRPLASFPRLPSILRSISIEWLLLGWAAVILVFTYSRTGLVILALLAVVSYILHRRSAGSTLSAVHAPRLDGETPRPSVRRAVSAPRRRLLFEVILLILGISTVLVIIGSQNPYFSRFWRYWTEAKHRNRTYFEYIAFEQRFVYVETALNIFEAYPFLGVGLGNYAFYFDDMLPDRWYRMPEIIRQTTPVEGRDRLITPKNLLARLLAETGAFGTIVFITFVLAVLGCALFLYLSPLPEQRYWGISGLLGIIVFMIVTFSFDSFALPNMWVVFGMITAAAHIDEQRPDVIHPPDALYPRVETEPITS